jgi:hypothetical protein
LGEQLAGHRELEAWRRAVELDLGGRKGFNTEDTEEKHRAHREKRREERPAFESGPYEGGNLVR